MPISNYDITKAQTAKLFLRYDAMAIAAKYGLAHDEEYLYLPFLNRQHRISRCTGHVEWSTDGFQTVQAADYNTAMTLYDVLCYSRADATLSGRYVLVNSLPGIVTASRVGESITDDTAACFDRHPQRLRQACEALGGIPEGKGDVAYRLDLFPFLPVRLQFWQGDEEFPPCLKFLWDENTLQFMHYETVWYAAGCLRTRLREMVNSM